MLQLQESKINPIGYKFNVIYHQLYPNGIILVKKVRLAIAVNDEFVETTIEGICEGARTGHIGDGKIFVLPMDECIRIRTGERGNEAIG